MTSEEKLKLARGAILHALRRVSRDPDFSFHMVGTETLDRLCEALDELADRPKGTTHAEVLLVGTREESHCSKYKSLAQDFALHRDECPLLQAERIDEPLNPGGE